MVILENIDIGIDIDMAILQNIDIDKISNRFKFGISNRAISDPVGRSLGVDPLDPLANLVHKCPRATSLITTFFT